MINFAASVLFCTAPVAGKGGNLKEDLLSQDYLSFLDTSLAAMLAAIFLHGYMNNYT